MSQKKCVCGEPVAIGRAKCWDCLDKTMRSLHGPRMSKQLGRTDAPPKKSWDVPVPGSGVYSPAMLAPWRSGA